MNIIDQLKGMKEVVKERQFEKVTQLRDEFEKLKTIKLFKN